MSTNRNTSRTVELMLVFIALSGCDMHAREFAINPTQDAVSPQDTGLAPADCRFSGTPAECGDCRCQNVRVSPGDRPSISSDGRFIAFDSQESLIECDDNGKRDVYVYDRESHSLSLESARHLSTTPGNLDSYHSNISPNGRYVIFMSNATNLVDGDTNDALDLFVRDRQEETTVRVNVSTSGSQGTGNVESWYYWGPKLSGDGRFAVFSSNSRDLVDGDTNDVEDIFVRDLEAATTTRVSLSTAGKEGNQWSFGPSISVDGRFVSYTSWASNLVSNDLNEYGDVFVYDRQLEETTRIEVSFPGFDGSPTDENAILSADGRSLIFRLGAKGFVVHDLQVNTTEQLVEQYNDDTVGLLDYGAPLSVSVSGDGHLVAFASASNIRGDSGEFKGVFVYDRDLRAGTRVSISLDGEPSDGDSRDPSISADGRFVAYSSGATNLAEHDTNGMSDIVVVAVPQANSRSNCSCRQ